MEMTTGMSAPPIGTMMSTPSRNDTAGDRARRPMWSLRLEEPDDQSAIERDGERDD